MGNLCCEACGEVDDGLQVAIDYVRQAMVHMFNQFSTTRTSIAAGNKACVYVCMSREVRR